MGTHGDRSSAQSTRSESTGSVRYRCISCHRPRSSTYHSRHPPEEPPPPPGVCRRCIRKEEHPTVSPATLYEVHHYHHTCGCRNEQPTPSTPVSTHVSTPVEPPPYTADIRCAELPVEERRRESPSMDQHAEETPPPVKFWLKPSYQRG